MFHLRLTAIPVCLLASLSFGACSSDSPGADSGVVSLAPTLDNIQAHIFDQACSMRGCHASESPGGGLDLSSADASFAALVGVPVVNSVASQNGWLLVVPGEPELSFLVRKIGAPGLGEGAPMPMRTKLSPFYEALIRDWIGEGAVR
jgi:hypothetical protein